MLTVIFRRSKLFHYPGEDILLEESLHSYHSGTRQYLHQHFLETSRTRLLVTISAFMLVFAIITGRLIEITIFVTETSDRPQRLAGVSTFVRRADITDRNGVVLATALPTVSLYANTHDILDCREAAQKAVSVLPELNFREVFEKLSSKKSFVYLKRNLTPYQQYEIHRCGIPGLYFEHGERRVYPYGSLVAHVVGGVDIDNRGIAGVEKTFNDQLLGSTSASQLRLSLDIRLQHIVHDELMRTVEEFHAIGGAGIIADVNTGEILSIVSLPDFNPNNHYVPKQEALFNRATLGVYEMGSTFKLFTATAALDGGFARLENSYDATNPIKVANFTIRDYHPQRRWLTIPEIMIHSSNIGAVKIVQTVGTSAMKDYLDRLGFLQPLTLELPEVGSPLIPSPWREINTLTVAYGHGLAVTPAHVATAITTVVNGGFYRPATLLYHKTDVPNTGTRVLKAETSRQIRWLMRRVVEEGTGVKADVPGYFVGGKTGTAEKSHNGAYARKALLSSFVAAFPMDSPRYAVIVIVDEPEGNKSTFGYATGGWTAAPAVGHIIARVAPVLGMIPTKNSWEALNLNRRL